MQPSWDEDYKYAVMDSDGKWYMTKKSLVGYPFLCQLSIKGNEEDKIPDFRGEMLPCPSYGHWYQFGNSCFKENRHGYFL